MVAVNTSRCCVLLSKPAEPGRVKTRLLPVLTPQQAAELHQAFLDDLIPRLLEGRFDLAIAWAMKDGEDLPESPAAAFRQRGADLGERLYNALARVATRKRFVAAIGSDHPELSIEVIEQGFDLLEGTAEVVLGPAEDGGYYFIGARSDLLSRELFSDIHWGTSSVLSATVDRCTRMSLTLGLLPRGHDVDRPKDLERLENLLRSDAGRCPHTERVLRSWGRLG